MGNSLILEGFTSSRPTIITDGFLESLATGDSIYYGNGTILIDGIAAIQLLTNSYAYFPLGHRIDVDGTYSRYIELARSGTGTVDVNGTLERILELSRTGSGTVDVDGLANSLYTNNFFTFGTGTVDVNGTLERILGLSRTGSGTVDVDGLANSLYTALYFFIASGKNTITLDGITEKALEIYYQSGGTIVIDSQAVYEILLRFMASGTIDVDSLATTFVGYKNFIYSIANGTALVDGNAHSIPGFIQTSHGTIQIDGILERIFELSRTGSGTIDIDGFIQAQQGYFFSGYGTALVDGNGNSFIFDKHFISLANGTALVDGTLERILELSRTGSGTALVDGTLERIFELTRTGSGTIDIDGTHRTLIDFNNYPGLATVLLDGDGNTQLYEAFYETGIFGERIVIVIDSKYRLSIPIIPEKKVITPEEYFSSSKNVASAILKNTPLSNTAFVSEKLIEDAKSLKRASVANSFASRKKVKDAASLKREKTGTYESRKNIKGKNSGDININSKDIYKSRKNIKDAESLKRKKYD